MRQDPPSIERKSTTRPDAAEIARSIREIQAGRDVETHFRRIFEAYEPHCRRILAGSIAESELEDLVQDVMVRVYKGVKTFRLDASFETWLSRIVKNAGRNAHRDRNTEKAKATRASLEGLLDSDDGAGPALAEPRSPDPDPLDETLESERREHLERALEALPKRMRRCVELWLFHGFAQKEIARIENVSVATVKKHIGEGRKRLRPVLSTFAELFGLFLLLALVL